LLDSEASKFVELMAGVATFDPVPTETIQLGNRNRRNEFTWLQPSTSDSTIHHLSHQDLQIQNVFINQAKSFTEKEAEASDRVCLFFRLA